MSNHNSSPIPTIVKFEDDHEVCDQQKRAAYEQGARAATEAMTYYFRNENEVVCFPELSEDMLTDFAAGAVEDALRDQP